MKCRCCSSRLYRPIEQFGDPAEPVCLLCWLKGRERYGIYGGPTTFQRHQEFHTYQVALGNAVDVAIPGLVSTEGGLAA